MQTAIRSLIFLVLAFFIGGISTLVGQSTKNNTSSVKTEPKLLFNPHKSIKIIEKKRNSWIKKSVDSLFVLSVRDSVEISSPKIIDLPDLKMISYRINRLGRIVFPEGDSILIFLHSAHEDMEIGDVSLAIKSDKSIYVNFGHVCGGIIHFMHLSAAIPMKPINFFETFYADTDDAKWMKWK